MKNIKRLTAGMLALLMGTTASAATVEISDSANSKVTVSVTGREPGELVNILVVDAATVVPEGKTLIEVLEEDVTKLQHQASFVSNDAGEGSYTFKLNLPAGFTSADYKVYVSGENEPNEVYFVPFETVKNIAMSIVSQTDKATLAGMLETYKRELSLVNDLFTNADKVSIAEKIIAAQAKEETKINFQNNEEAAVIELQRRIKEYSCISCFESNKKDVLFDENGAYLYNSVVPINGIDVAADGNTAAITVNNLFNNAMTAEGQANVKESLFGIKYADVKAVQAQYAKAVIVNAIKKSNEQGAGVVTKAVTKGNAALAGISVEKYLNLSDKTTANRAIIATALTTENLESTINASAVKTPTSTQGSGGTTTSPSRPSTVSPGSGSVYVPTNPSTPDVPKKSFNDTSSHWASDAIASLAEKNIISGYDDGTFKPDKTVSREEACKIIAEAFDITAGGDVEFGDVNKTDWFYPYVCALAEKNIINGVTDESFGTGMEMTREAFSVLIYRLLELEPPKQAKEFSDKENISDWALEAVGALSEKGIINGYDDGSFMPKKTLTRAETATIIYQILKAQEG